MSNPVLSYAAVLNKTASTAWNPAANPLTPPTSASAASHGGTKPIATPDEEHETVNASVAETTTSPKVATSDDHHVEAEEQDGELKNDDREDHVEAVIGSCGTPPPRGEGEELSGILSAGSTPLLTSPQQEAGVEEEIFSINTTTPVAKVVNEGGSSWKEKFVTPDTVASTPSPKNAPSPDNIEDEDTPHQQLSEDEDEYDDEDAMPHVPSPGGRMKGVDVRSPHGSTSRSPRQMKSRNSGSSCSSGDNDLSSGCHTACFDEDIDLVMPSTPPSMSSVNVAPGIPTVSPNKLPKIAPQIAAAVHPAAAARILCYDAASALVKTALALALRHDSNLKKLGGGGDISVAVVDATGTLIAFGRDPAKKATAMSATFAVEKAKSAVLFGCDTLLLKGVGAQQSSPVATIGSSPVTYLLSGGGVLVSFCASGSIHAGAIGISSGTEFLESKTNGEADDALAREVLAEVFGEGSSGSELFGLQRGRGFGGGSYDNLPGTSSAGNNSIGGGGNKKKKKGNYSSTSCSKQQPGSGCSTLMGGGSEHIFSGQEEFPGQRAASLGALNPPTHYGLAIPTSQDRKLATPGSGGQHPRSSFTSTNSKNKSKKSNSMTSSGDSLIGKIRADSETYYEYMQRRQRATTAMEVGPTMSSMLSCPPGLENEIMSAPPHAISLGAAAPPGMLVDHHAGEHSTYLDAISEQLHDPAQHHGHGADSYRCFAAGQHHDDHQFDQEADDDGFDCATLAGLDANTPTNSACGGSPSAAHLFAVQQRQSISQNLQANVNISRAAFGGAGGAAHQLVGGQLQQNVLLQKMTPSMQVQQQKKANKKTRNYDSGSSAASGHGAAYGGHLPGAGMMMNPLDCSATLLSSDAEKAHAASVGVVTSGKHHVRTISIDGAVATSVAAVPGGPSVCIRGQAVVGVGGTLLSRDSEQPQSAALPVSADQPQSGLPPAAGARSRTLSLEEALRKERDSLNQKAAADVRTISLGSIVGTGGNAGAGNGGATSATVAAATSATATATAAPAAAATTVPTTAAAGAARPVSGAAPPPGAADRNHSGATSSQQQQAATAAPATTTTTTSPGIAIPSGARDHPVVKPHKRQEMLHLHQNLQNKSHYNQHHLPLPGTTSALRTEQTSVLSNGIILTHNKEHGAVSSRTSRGGAAVGAPTLELYQQIEGEIVLPGGGAPGGAGNNRGGVSKTFIFH